MSSISAGTTTTTGYVVSSDTTGALVLKTGASGTTALTIDTSQNVTFVGSQTLSGGTANGVAYLNGSKVVTSGSGLVFDGTNLGIGISGPLVKLDSRGDAYFGANARIQIVESSGDAVIGGRAGTNYLALTVNGSEGMRLTSTGLGIGTSSPSVKLDVYGSDPRIQSYNSSGPKNILLAGSTAGYTGMTTNHPLVFITNDTERARIDSSGNFSVGNTAAAYVQLQPAGNVRGVHASGAGGDTILGAINGVSNGYQISVTTGNAQTYKWHNGGTQSMTLDASGNLLVGTTSANGKFHVRGTAAADMTCRLEPVNNSYASKLLMSSQSSGDGGIQYGAAGGNNLDIFAYDTIKLFTGTGSISGGIGTERARIDQSGNFTLGIAASPYNNAKMEIYRTSAGDALMLSSVTGSGSSQALAWSNSRGDVVSARIYNIDDGFYGAAIAFANRTGPGTSTTERVRITSGGDFCIGKTSASETYNTGTGYGFSMAGLDPFFSIVNTKATGGNACIYLNRRNVSSTSGLMVFLSNDGNSQVTVGTITHNGTNTSYNTSSDYRLKENIQPMTGALAKVAALKPCTYKWKTNGSDGEGFIAHELQEIIPGAVAGEKDAVDKNGDIDPQGIDTSYLVATLTAAIQEQQALIESLTQRIAALEGTS